MGYRLGSARILHDAVRISPGPTFSERLLDDSIREGIESMNFVGLSRPLSDQGMNSVRQSLSVGLAELWTVLQVETRGCGFLVDRRPVILFERHVFHAQT